MKVTRLQRGYRINLTDSDFTVLWRLLRQSDNDPTSFSPAEKRAFNKRFSLLDPLVIDDDRRVER